MTAHIVKSEGFRSLWSGVTPAIYRHYIYTGFRMGIYENLRNYYKEKHGDTKHFGTVQAMICGLVSGAIAQFAASPMDLVKVQMQMEGLRKLSNLPIRYKSTWQASSSLYRSQGFFGLWMGWVPNCQRAALLNMADLATYDTVKHGLLKHTDMKDNWLLHSISSVCSGLSAAIVSVPSDVVKTRMMDQIRHILDGKPFNLVVNMTHDIAEGILLGMGNPLLDIQTIVPKSFLDKFGLKENDAILADDNHVPMFEELVKLDDIQYIPGGATQNALRVCQWIIQKPNACGFFGAVGDDTYGQTLKEKAALAGVNVQYQINPAVKTGTCAALINDSNRSLVAHLAAANTFTIDHLKEAKHFELVEKAKYYYISGFFLTVCPEAIQTVAEHAAKNNKTFMMNLAAPFVCQFFKDQLNAALPYVDILFGNETEANVYAEAHDFKTTDLKEIALKLSSLPKANAQRTRTVVITHGDKPTIVAVDGKITEYPIIKLSKEQLVDTNGAGDAFCGGFFAKLIQNESFDECIKCANTAASIIIQQQGCTFPPQFQC
uniref:Adenosine kinase n=1 Tax=Rhabditophanes sp. KR3021 TaxID=114890 RepID=A0AC35U668_9BILA